MTAPEASDDVNVAEPNKGWFKRWRAVIFSGVIIAVMTGVWISAFRDFRNQPVVSPYAEVIDAFYAQSPKAKERLDAYYASSQRSTVATKDFSELCFELKSIALQSGVVVTDKVGPVDRFCGPLSAGLDAQP